MNHRIQQIQDDLATLRISLLSHELYSKVNSIDQFRIFTQQHVFAVWDFMSLLKTLQRSLTCVSVPWSPVGSPEVRRFINEIVLGEESDINQNSEVISHFELYCNAMIQLGADLTQIDLFREHISSGKSVFNTLNMVDVFPETRDFVKFTFQTIESNEIHRIAAVFTFGREDLIPEMFISILKGLQKKGFNQVSQLLYYLERHIEIDGEDHGPISLRMIQEICGEEDQKWTEASEAAQQALKMRIHLWNGILARI